MRTIHDPENVRAIDDLYVFLSIDEQGRHGILGAILPGIGTTPLVTGSPTVAEAMKAKAREIAQRTDKRVGLFRFTRAEMMEEM